MGKSIYKFRAKDIKGNWHYGFYVGIGNVGAIIENTEYSVNENVKPYALAYKEEEFSIVLPDTIGQFTGLKDKNNVEVYEGDILHVKEYRNAAQSDEEMDKIDIDILKAGLTDEYVGEVCFDEGSFFVCGTYLGAFFGDQRHSFPIHEIEVVGNIYENKDLLTNKA